MTSAAGVASIVIVESERKAVWCYIDWSVRMWDMESGIVLVGVPVRFRASNGWFTNTGGSVSRRVGAEFGGIFSVALNR